MKKILIVDDNEKNRRLMRDILIYHGFDILEAENGEQGVEMAKKHRPDLILMDIQMPFMDGYAALQMIRNDPEINKIIVIAITSYAMKGDREKLIMSGFDDYIAKPIDTRKLPEIVKQYTKM